MNGEKGNCEWWRAVLDSIGGAAAGDGARGASAEEIAALEGRLGRTLSASYKAFLQTSNGFPAIGIRLGRMLGTAEVDWYRNRNPEAARAIQEAMQRPGENRRPFSDPKWTIDIPLHSIEATEAAGGVRLLLHPRRGKGGGEWDPWLVGPGKAKRFPGLVELFEYLRIST